MWVYISSAYRVSGFLFGFVFNKTFGPRNAVPWSQAAKSLPAKCLHTALSSERAWTGAAALLAAAATGNSSSLDPSWSQALAPLGAASALLFAAAVRNSCHWRISILERARARVHERALSCRHSYLRTGRERVGHRTRDHNSGPANSSCPS